MARLVIDDSADEFPSEGIQAGRAASRERITKSSVQQAQAQAQSQVKVMEAQGVAAVVVKKKRILGHRRDDNPLLRPLGMVRGDSKVRDGRRDIGEVVEEKEERTGVSPEIFKTQRDEDPGRKPGRAVRRVVGRRNVKPISGAEGAVPISMSTVKTRTVRGRIAEENSELEIQETQREEERSNSEKIARTTSKFKAANVRSKRVEKTSEIEIQETQQAASSSSSESEAPVPATTTRFKNRSTRTKRTEKTPETESPETQQEETLRTVQPKSRIEEKQKKISVLEIQETQQGEDKAEVLAKSRGLVKRSVTPVSDSDDSGPVSRWRLNKRTSKNKGRLQISEVREDDPFFSDSSSKTALKRPPSNNTTLSRVNTDSEEYTDGMSDFVVNDSEIEDVPAPRSTRRLVKGRRQVKDEIKGKKDLADFMREMNIDSDELDSSTEQLKGKKMKEINTRLEESFKEALAKDLTYSKLRSSSQTSTDLDDPFTVKFTPPRRNVGKVSKELRFTTPPGSPDPKPKGLQSPKKMQRIPSTPHGPSVDDFWSQDVVNDWNDEYSPRKTPKPPSKPLFSKANQATEVALSPKKQDRINKDAKKVFAERKHVLAETFLIELDTAITNGQVAKLAATTGGVKIIWSKKLNTTAGRANWKRETVRSSTLIGPDGKPLTTYRHHAAIELAEKVIDDEDRLLNVIAHEFCHLANFMISNIKTNPHGKEFKAWASQVSRQFRDRGIEVTTKHSYTIDYKYIWECENCGLEFKRHSKSIDPTRHRCGSCKAKLVQTKPVPRKGVVISEYQVFLKENMKVVMKENPRSPQKEILGLVGKKYQEFKAGKAAGTKSESVDIREIDVTSKEGTPTDDGLDFVSRKLDFLDLTSP